MCDFRSGIVFRVTLHRWHFKGVFSKSAAVVESILDIFPSISIFRTSSEKFIVDNFLSLLNNGQFSSDSLNLVHSEYFNVPSCGIKYSVVNEFQCFLVFKKGELKSFEITCRWTCSMLGIAWYPILKSSSFCPFTSITFTAIKYISFSKFKWFLLNCKEIVQAYQKYK